MQSDNFYITLISSASLNYFPTNVIGKFQNQLPYPLQLKGYEVALVEITYEHSFPNVYAPTSNYVSFSDGINETARVELTEKNYSTSISLINAFKALMKRHAPPYVIETRSINHTYIKSPPANYTGDGIELPPTLHAKLGFTPDQPRMFLAGSPPVASTFKANPKTGCKQMYVYCDAILPRVFGSSVVPLLRTVAVTSEFGETKTVTFDAPQYLSCHARETETVEISINFLDGVVVPFNGGLVTVTLHFRFSR